MELLAGVLETFVAQHNKCRTSTKDTVQVENVAQAKNRLLCIFCVIFLYFGPYFVDIGHDFVDSVKNWLRFS